MIQRNRFLTLPRARFIQGPVAPRLILAGSLIGLTVWACGGEEPTGPGGQQQVASVAVTPRTTTLVSLGETIQLTASFQDGSGNAISGKTFTWSSSDANVATVSAAGLVTAVANGSVRIMATSDGVSGTVAVDVHMTALLFENPTFSCPDGATNTAGQVSFGDVSWRDVFVGAAALGPDHVHYELQLKGVDPGSYRIFGNQAEDPACNGATRHINTFTVEENRQGSASGQFNFPVHDFGTTKVWVTVSGPAGAATTLFYRSPAVTMVIAAHVLGHER